jgi:hypothetical protein
MARRKSTGGSRRGTGRRPTSARGPRITLIPYPGSRSIEAAGYLSARRLMHIRYAGGRLYAYKDVPPAIYRDFLEADSKGQFVNWHIKPNFDYEEID